MRIIGLGNEQRRDDGAGPAVLRRLRALGCHADLQLSDGEPTRLLELFSGADHIIIVDAMCSGARPGFWRRFTDLEELSAGQFPMSSHQLGLAELIEMARSLKLAMGCLEIIGIESAELSLGCGLTPSVLAAVEAVVANLQAGCDS